VWRGPHNFGGDNAYRDQTRLSGISPRKHRLSPLSERVGGVIEVFTTVAEISASD